MLPCGRTDGRTNKQTSENRATQSLDSVRLSFAMWIVSFEINYFCLLQILPEIEDEAHPPLKEQPGSFYQDSPLFECQILWWGRKTCKKNLQEWIAWVMGIWRPYAFHDPVHEVLPPVLPDFALQPVMEAPHQHLLNPLNMALDQEIVGSGLFKSICEQNLLETPNPCGWVTSCVPMCIGKDVCRPAGALRCKKLLLGCLPASDRSRMEDFFVEEPTSTTTQGWPEARLSFTSKMASVPPLSIQNYFHWL